MPSKGGRLSILKNPKMKKILVTAAMCFAATLCLAADAAARWEITPRGSICWQVGDNVPHNDHIEMSGKFVSTVVRYGVDADGAFNYTRGMVFPMLRTIPNNTHASLMRRLAWNPLDGVTLNGRCVSQEQVKSIELDGIMTVESECEVYWDGKAAITRVLFPSTNLPAFIEQYTIRNTGESPIVVEIPESKSTISTDPEKGVAGSYKVENGIIGARTVRLEPGAEVAFDAYTVAYLASQSGVEIDAAKEKQKRTAFVASLREKLILETPDTIINTMFDFAKLRAAESIYQTAQGPMHGPGGESYYAAVWANDEAEYINPFFPFLGYDYGNASVMNSFAHFARYMNPEYAPVPSSIVAEGLSYWNGVGDRGDAAMIAYGASRYALASGNLKEAEELWPLIEWCLEFSRRKVNAEGVVSSDTDELENRFPSGDANLCTSSLYYDALISASYLGKELGKPVAAYQKQAKALRVAIENYFGAKVEGFDTYQYYQGNDVLRSWICIPLTVGIYDRTPGTVDAIFSPRLWTNNGLLTAAGSETFWDRSTLYALRGVYAAGETKRANDYLKYYSAQRLLGDHVPYAIEAWPEGGQRHLSGESGLYCRIITEGMFGIRPTGLHSFEVTPRLPQEWPSMALRQVNAFGKPFDVEVSRNGDKLLVNVVADGKSVVRKSIADGATLQVKL